MTLSVTTISACIGEQSVNQNAGMIELSRENEELTNELQLVTESLKSLQNSQAGFISQQIVGQPVKYAEPGDTLKDVQDRKLLRCGGNADLPGFGYLDPDSSQFIGFDIDFCRAIGAAVLGEQGSAQVKILPLASNVRFAALQAGEVDVLTRNTTWTMSRDAELRANYAGVTFYDGQGILVRKKDEIKKLSDLNNKSICVQNDSTSQRNIEKYFISAGMTVEVLGFDHRVAAMKQYDQKTCDGYTGDKSSLLAQQSLLSRPTDHFILHQEISREPLGPLVRHDDDNWMDVVRWTLQCLINAEYLGLSENNILEKMQSDPEGVNEALGINAKVGRKIGLDDDFCYQIVVQVGSYKDIYNRHLGPDSDFNLPRGLNALYVDGGLHYPLPLK